MNVKLHPRQSDLMRDNHRYKVIRCGRRFGKTWFAVTKIIYEAMKSQGDYWFVAPTYRQAKDIAWQLFRKILPEKAIKRIVESPVLEIDLLNGSHIALKGADNPDSLRGVGLDGIVLDEYAFQKPYVWSIVSPMLQDRKGWAIFISTPDGYNHFKDLCDIDDPDYKTFHFTSYDNPYLDPAELDKEKGRMSLEMFSQEYMAEFMKRAGAIYPMFSRDIHIVDRRQPKEGSTIYGSIDFGFAIGHETAVLWHEVTSEGVYTFDGFDVSQKTIKEIDELMKGQTNGLTIRGIFPDPARPDLIEELKRLNWPIRETNKDVELGIAKVAEYMQFDPINKKPKWTISKHLANAIDQIEQYVWTEVRSEDGKFKQTPKKENDNYPDSLRYFIFNYLNQPAQKRQPIVGFTGGDPITGFGRRPIRKKGRGIDFLE